MFEFVTRDTEKCPSSLFTGVHIEQVNVIESIRSFLSEPTKLSNIHEYR